MRSKENWRALGVSAHPEAPISLRMSGALRRGDMELYRELSERVGSINPKADWGPWLAGMLSQGAARFESLSPDEEEPMGTALSTLLTHIDDPNIVDRALALGVGVDDEIDEGKSMMAVALAGRFSNGGGLECVERLIEAGASPTAAGPGGDCAAWVACWEGREGLLRKMLAQGLDPDWRDPARGGERGSLLRLCLEKERCVAQEGRAACAKALLEAGARVSGAVSERSLSLLEEMMRGKSNESWLVSFSYLSDTGLSAKDCLPATRQGFESLDKAWKESLGVEEYPPGAYDLQEMEQRSMGWLSVCFEAMRLELCAEPKPRRGPKNL